MKSGSWGSLFHIYAYGIASAASLSKVIPLHDQIGQIPGATPASFALLISLLAVPPALLGTLAGSIIDRVGARATMIAVCLTGALANFLYLQASSMNEFFAIRLLEGFTPMGIYAAAPALMMATASPARRDRAMSLWSTYTPVGVSTGLMLTATAIAFAGNWKAAFATHGVLFVALAVAGLALPGPGQIAGSPLGARPQRPSVLAILSLRDGAGPLRLALAFGTLIVLGFGMSIVFPTWFARAHGMSVSQASGILAAANIVMILGGTLSGFLLGRGMRGATLFIGLAIVGSVAGAGVFAPHLDSTLGIGALLVWLITTGAAMAVAASTLPRVAEPSRRAATAGLLSQTGAIMTFITPSIWLPALAHNQWLVLVGIVVTGWLISTLLLPHAGAPARGNAAAGLQRS